MKTSFRKKMLLASAAAAVMGFGMVATPAMAFDDVSWSWDKQVTEDVLKNVNVLIDVAPTGMLELEKAQFQIGDVTASSTVTNFTNNPPGEETQAAPAPAPFTVDIEAPYFANQTDNPVDADNTIITADGFSASNISGNDDQVDDTFFLTFDLTDMQPAPAPIPIGERDALDLPKVESVATAVGNNQDIFSTVSTELHDGQFLFGDFTDAETVEEAASNVETLLGFAPDLNNTHTEVAATLGLASALGLIEPATISADSTVTGILNATVDSDATAVGNNMSVELAAFTPDDAMMIADVTQFSYADVSATSLVDDVTIEGYTGLGAAGLGPASDPQIPSVSSTATAVGNNLSISVSSPDTL